MPALPGSSALVGWRAARPGTAPEGAAAALNPLPVPGRGDARGEESRLLRSCFQEKFWGLVRVFQESTAFFPQGAAA